MYNIRYSATFCATADSSPDEISPAPAEDERSSGREDEKRHDLSPADVLSPHSTAERLDISENTKKRNDRRPHKPPIYSTFHALTGTEAAAIQAEQISLMRRINRRSTEPQRSGATFTFALNPGRAVALLG